MEFDPCLERTLLRDLTARYPKCHAFCAVALRMRNSGAQSKGSALLEVSRESALAQPHLAANHDRLGIERMRVSWSDAVWMPLANKSLIASAGPGLGKEGVKTGRQFLATVPHAVTDVSIHAIPLRAPRCAIATTIAPPTTRLAAIT